MESNQSITWKMEKSSGNLSFADMEFVLVRFPQNVFHEQLYTLS